MLISQRLTLTSYLKFLMEPNKWVKVKHPQLNLRMSATFSTRVKYLASTYSFLVDVRIVSVANKTSCLLKWSLEIVELIINCSKVFNISLLSLVGLINLEQFIVSFFLCAYTYSIFLYNKNQETNCSLFIKRATNLCWIPWSADYKLHNF
jgi:hypothetical protein